MTTAQKSICRHFLTKCYSSGFENYYKISEASEKLGISPEDTLRDIHELDGKGILSISRDEKYATVNFDMKESVEAWIR